MKAKTIVRAKTETALLTKEKIAQLLKSGNWMIRFDNEGLSYDGFRWNPLGEWTEAPDWNTVAECQGGLFGQSPMAAGHSKPGSRMVLAETQGWQIAVKGNKIKVQFARILAVNEDIPLEFLIKLSKHGGALNLSQYKHQLPAGLTSIGGSVDLSGYDHELPAGLTSIGGSVDLSGYDHELPAGLTSIGGSVYLSGYDHELPAGLKIDKSKIIR